MPNKKCLDAMMTYAQVIESGSFTAAAEALEVSKAVVSKQITKLEKQLGVKLLHRTTRRLNMTEAGQIFYGYSQNLAREAEEALQAIGPLQNEAQGLLRVAAPESLGMSILPETLARFHQQYPKVQIDLQVSGKHFDLIDGGFDLALRIQGPSFHDSSLIMRKLCECQYICCASKTYLKASPELESPDDLAAHNCLIYTQRHQPHLWFFKDNKGQKNSFHVEGKLKSNNAQILMTATLEDQGIFYGPDFLFKKYLKKQLIEVLQDYYLPANGLFALYPQQEYMPAKLRAFLDFLVQEWI